MAKESNLRSKQWIKIPNWLVVFSFTHQITSRFYRTTVLVCISFVHHLEIESTFYRTTVLVYISLVDPLERVWTFYRTTVLVRLLGVAKEETKFEWINFALEMISLLSFITQKLIWDVIKPMFCLVCLGWLKVPNWFWRNWIKILVICHHSEIGSRCYRATVLVCLLGLANKLKLGLNESFKISTNISKTPALVGFTSDHMLQWLTL